MADPAGTRRPPNHGGVRERKRRRIPQTVRGRGRRRPMTTLRLKKTNGVPPRAAKIEGTNQKYGLDRNWRAVRRTPVEDDRSDYYSVRGNRIVKLDNIVPRDIGEHIRENRCSRDEA